LQSKPETGFAIWITGLPASGKSTLAAALRSQLEHQNIDIAVLESDHLRKIFTPTYEEKERGLFYNQLIFVGSLLTEHGVPVIFDATANRRAYRDMARRQITRFIEVYVDTPLATCVARDPKGLYRAATAGAITAMPGVQAAYEPPEHPDFVFHGDREDAEAAAAELTGILGKKGYLKREGSTHC
jgi:adenylylsulfate kinase